MLLGIDQGGSKTRVAVAADDGRILGCAEGPGGYYGTIGLQPAMERVIAVYKKVLDAAEVQPTQVSKVVAGMTGADWDHEYPLLRGALRDALAIEDVTVYNDCVIAFHAAARAGWGLVLCAGTGFNTAVLAPDGRRFLFGFYAKGRLCGGKSLGNRAIRVVSHSHVGLVPPTVLTARVLAHFGLDSVDVLLYRFESKKLDTKRINDLVPLVFQAAMDGDGPAEDMVAEFCRDVAAYAVAGLRRFDLLHLPVPVVFAGGVFKAAGESVRTRIINLIRDHACKLAPVDCFYEPVVGALRLALDLRPEDTARQSNFEKSAALHSLRYGGGMHARDHY